MTIVFDERATCPRAVGLIELFDGALPVEQIEDWGSHLERCLVCQAQFELLASQSTPQLSVGPGVSSTYLTAARQRLLVGPRSGFGENGDASKTETHSLTTQADPPQRIGQFSDLQLIGQGGMGVVYRAFDDVLRRAVAIKQLSPHLAASTPGRERFVREAQAAAAVVHEHVVAIHSVEEHASVPFIVMQFVPGENLQDRIDRAGPLELRETLRIGVEIALGLAAAHAQGVVHRDIKPSNILLEDGLGRVKITDFGLARVAAAAGLTQKGEAPGTPQYMSAEQARGEPVDSRSDLFSLGSVLYAMCTGRPPFEADSVLGILRQVADLPARPIHQLNPDVPTWLAAVIDRLHAKSSDERYQTAEEVAAILSAHLDDVQSGRVRRRRRWWVAAAAVGVAGALAACELTGVTSALTAIARLARSPADVQAAASSNIIAPSTVPQATEAIKRSELAALDAALQRDAADIPSLLRRAQVRSSLGEQDQAVADYTQVIATAGDVTQRGSALLARAQIYGDRAEWEAAIDGYSRFLDENPATASLMVYGRLAAIYVAGPESVRNPQKALELVKLRLRSPVAHAGYRTIQGVALYRVGQYSEAAQMLEAAAGEKGGYTPFNQFVLAMSWHKLGETDKAQRCYEAALEINTTSRLYLLLHALLRAEAEALLEIEPQGG